MPAGPNEASQIVTVTVNNVTSSSLFSVQPAISAAGVLTDTPAAEQFGTSTVTYTVSDNGGTANGGVDKRTFTVAVTGVNDAPSFTKGTDQTVNEDAGMQTVNPWATAVSAGPGESDQTVSFEITNNTNASLFSAGPSVSSTGVLTFTPAPNQNGTATITLRITDDGGTANGGINTSVTQTFNINVTAVNDPPVPQAKNFGAQANRQIQGLTGFLTGITDADAGVNGCTPTFSLSSVGATHPAGSLVTITDAANGVVTFDPPPGATGNVTFTYTVSDTGCPTPAQTGMATATVNVTGPVIWFVDSTAPAGGNGTWTGTNAKAFQTLAQAAAVDATDHRIFVLNTSGCD